jgi:hypothetical protein
MAINLGNGMFAQLVRSTGSNHRAAQLLRAGGGRTTASVPAGMASHPHARSIRPLGIFGGPGF